MTTATLSASRAGELSSDVILRPIEHRDGGQAARIVYEAFARIHDHHRFARDFPTREAATQLVEAFIDHPRIWGVVAEADGRIVGSNFLDERGPITGVGPITVSPEAQGARVGRRLMEAVLQRGRDARGVRLLQDSFNTASLSLYASLGFDPRAPIALLRGPVNAEVPARTEVRPAQRDDLAACEALSLRVHGYERTNELADAIDSPGLSPFVTICDGRVTAYATTLALFPAAHAVAESDESMQALIAGAVAPTGAPAAFLLPVRQAELFRWCLNAGLRVVKPMTYMTVGEYREPRGAWLPSVLY
jgi:GNAT superfamily N-acetyltransferase